MALHILAMNMLAPLLALAWHRLRHADLSWTFNVAAVTSLQLVAVWGWHAPSAFASATSVPMMGAAMHLTLFLAALLFWRSVIHAISRTPWQSIAALLMTGKLVCLLGVLLIFSPRPLYGSATHGATSLSMGLMDQQSAGLLMLITCPLTYVLGSIMIVQRWFTSSERTQGWRFDQTEP